jgi:hypothetical protein
MVVHPSSAESPKFEPQIVSVKSMLELCAKPPADTTSIFEANLKPIIKEEDLVTLNFIDA